MLTNCVVILTVFDPNEYKVTNFSNAKQENLILDKDRLVEERFSPEDVGYFF